METCANCGDTIGNLETPRTMHGQIVCAACHRKLAGVPLAYAAPPLPAAAMTPVQTIQQTSKIWKIQILLASLICIAGVILSCAGYNAGPGNEVLAGGGILLFAGGLFWFIIARVAAWWFHG